MVPSPSLAVLHMLPVPGDDADMADTLARLAQLSPTEGLSGSAGRSGAPLSCWAKLVPLLHALVGNGDSACFDGSDVVCYLDADTLVATADLSGLYQAASALLQAGGKALPCT